LFIIFFISNKFIRRVNLELSKNIYSYYLNLNFEKSIKVDKNLKYSFIAEADYYSVVLKSFIALNSEVITVAIIIIYIAMLSFANISYAGIALIIFPILVAIILLNNIKKKNKELGGAQRILFKKNLDIVLEGLSSLREIRIFNKENYFIENFVRLKKKALKNIYINDFFNFFPKPIIEICLLVLVSSFFLISSNNSNLSDFLPIIGFVTMSSFRVIPSLNKIILNTQVLQKNVVVIDELFKKYSLVNNYKSKKFNALYSKLNLKKNISFSNVSFFFNKKKILDKTNLLISRGEVVGVFGPSGSGKSTFANLISGFYLPTAGRILIDNKVLLNDKIVRNFWRIISIAPQKIFLLRGNAINNICFGESNIDNREVDNLLSIFDINFHKKNLGEDGLKISGGQVQRIGLARALYKKPEILIIDEATNSLDKISENIILRKLVNKFKKENKILIIISHDKKILNKFSDYIFVIKNYKMIKTLKIQ
jgi:ATP-binding cassette subfamily C protein